MADHANTPSLDFRSFSSSNPDRAKALKLLDDAFRNHGFIYLSNYSIPQELIDEAFQWTKQFFHLPAATKAMIRRSTNPFDPRGYTTIGDAVVNQETQPKDLDELAKARSTAAVEQRETLELGNPYSRDLDQNRLLPDDMFPGFREWLEKWWDACMSLQLEIMTCLGEILSADDTTSATVLVQQQTPARSRTNMSLIHYHSMAYADLRSQKSSRCNAHTDSGQLTLLFQDGVGGLEVLGAGPQAPFVAVPPRPGAMIVQLGDMLEKQSNGRWRSALHRVTAPKPAMSMPSAPEQTNGDDKLVLQDRYSIAFFVYPDFETVMDSLPGCEEKGPWNSLDWGNVRTAGDWWRHRIQLEFGGHEKRAMMG